MRCFDHRSKADVLVGFLAAIFLLTTVCDRTVLASQQPEETPTQFEELEPPALDRSRRSSDSELADRAELEKRKMALWGKRDEDKRGMAMWGRRELDDAADAEKRIGQLSSWGKKRDNSWLNEATQKALRSKWGKGNMAVWGKRALDDEEEKKNKWNRNSMPVWGKRDDQKRGWENRNMALWG